MKHKHPGRFGFSALALCAGLLIPPSLTIADAQTTGAAVAAPQSRITLAISDQNLIRLSGNTPVFIRHATDLGAAANDLPLEHLQLVLKSGDAQQSALAALLQQQQKPGSANYHKWLTPQAFGEQYGVSEADLNKITAWLTQQGFNVEGVSQGRTIITFSGTQQQLRSTFHTEIHQYSIGGRTHFANASDPMIPAALAPVVSGFSSLTTYGRTPLHTTPRLARRAPGGKWQTSPAASVRAAAGTGKSSRTAAPQFTTTIEGSTALLVAPGDFGTIYNVSPLWTQKIDGSGQTIAIVAESDVNPADIDAFRTAFGLPEKKFNPIYVGVDPGYTQDEVEGEADLDVEWAGAIAPNATIDLVVSEPTNVGGGVLAAAQYAVDTNTAPILSVSYGGCELALGVSTNQFFNQLWEQAAAEGITVIVAAGDSGSATCDQNEEYADYGEQVSGFASTPYNTAVGGTDFSGNYFQDASQFWSNTNDPNTQASALSYVPETPWNETCASPLVLAAAQASGFDYDTTTEALCNDFDAPFLDTAAGGGGASRCTSSDGEDPTTCTGGYPAPDWQLPIPGMPQNGARNLPDISFFSGTGIWGSAYVFCQSDSTPDQTCNYQNGDIEYLVAGGTSFAAPAFAGVVALMEQKLQTPLGNINYPLYQIGAAQYGGNGPAVFHDIVAGNNSVPCLAGSLAIPPETLCSTTDPDDYFGVLPDYNAGVGYDLASGLGSADVSALADAWAAEIAGLTATKTTLTLTGSSTTVYGTPLPVQIQVAAASGAQQPTGGIALFDQDTAGGTPIATAQLAAGSVAISGNGMPAGAHTLYARYAGNGTFGESSSNTVAITVTQAATNIVLSPSRTTVDTGQSVSFGIDIETTSTASSPTGSVTLTNTTTGKTVAVVPVNAATDASTSASIGHVFVNIPGQQLTSGSNVITVTYGGDGNYTSSSNTATISYTSPFSLTLPQSSLTLAPGSTTGNVLAITVTPNDGATLNASTLSFSCPGTLPAGLTCSFSAPVVGSNGAVTSNLTILLSGPLAATPANTTAWLGAGAMTGLACVLLLGLPGKRRRYPLAVILGAVSVLTFTIGCSGGGGAKIQPNNQATTTALSVSSATPAFNSPVTLSATVAPVNGSGSPTGTVTFQNSSNVLGSAPVSGGAATLTTSSLAIGQETIIASYGGDSSFTGSTSASANVDVTLTAPLTVQVTDSTGNAASQPLTITVK